MNEKNIKKMLTIPLFRGIKSEILKELLEEIPFFEKKIP